MMRDMIGKKGNDVNKIYKDNGMEELKIKEVRMLTEKNAIAVRLKEPFLKWLENLDETINIAEAESERSLYTIPGLVMFDEDTIEDYLRGHYREIFATELCGWYTDSGLWPKEASYEMFREWFEIEMVDAVYDITKREAAYN
jgi:hypothetical protein